MSTGPRCGPNCGSSTISPATVYFPQGYLCPIYSSEHILLIPSYPSTYLVTDSIPLYYYTEIIGDARELPTILAAANYNATAPPIFGRLLLLNRNGKTSILAHFLGRC